MITCVSSFRYLFILSWDDLFPLFSLVPICLYSSTPSRVIITIPDGREFLLPLDPFEVTQSNYSIYIRSLVDVYFLTFILSRKPSLSHLCVVAAKQGSLKRPFPSGGTPPIQATPRVLLSPLFFLFLRALDCPRTLLDVLISLTCLILLICVCFDVRGQWP